MKTVIHYDNYRLFLKEFYQWKKVQTPGYSHKTFLDKAGLSGPNFLREVIKGLKNLSPASVKKFSIALGLNIKESKYFANLVLFNQAKKPADKEKYYQALTHFTGQSSAQQIRKDQLEYFSHWYNIAVREYLHAHPFKSEFETLARSLNPSITVLQAKKAVDLLQRLGLVEKDKRGYYQLTDTLVGTADGLKSLAVHNYHKSMLKNSVKLMETTTPEDRYIRSLGGSFSDEAFEAIRLELDAAKEKIMGIIERDKGEQKKVHHIGFQMLPLEKAQKKRRNSKNERD